MKKLINSPETVVTEALQGIAAAHPSLSVDIENKVIVRAGGPRPGKVGLAEEGADLAAVAAVAREVNERSRSFGVALSSCVVPSAGKPTFELGEAEVELGIGIHGEPGRTRAALTPASELAAFALDAIRADLPVDGDLRGSGRPMPTRPRTGSRGSGTPRWRHEDRPPGILS